jgi:putative peptide zinc metalloprotease protein
MTSMADSLVNSAMRPLKLRRRPDLESRRHKYHGRSYWVVKEPVGLNYYRFHDEEFAILNMLDGRTSLQQIKDSFQAEFAPQRISLQDLQQFVGMLHRSGLVISHASGQGRQLRRRGDQKKRKEFLGKLANIFAIRFRGIDPERILTALLPWFGWLFTVWCLIAVACLGLAAIMLVLINYHEFKTKLPTFEQFFAAKNWIWLGLTMATVKVLHEFGHGLSCKKFGGECHEMGAMLLVFTPCLYCNVSDSWMLPNKWQRVFIGAAGMYVELILASIATFLWWFSEDGAFNFLCLSVMFICSVSTVVFNGNPLLRFDGYYILMDILEIPNLRQKANEILKRWFQKNCLGLELQDNPFLPTRNRLMFALYTVASFIYRWVVAIGIIFFLNQVLKPYGLQALGRIFAISGIVGMIVPGLFSIWKFFSTPGKASKMKQANVVTSLLVAFAALSVFCFLPLPFHVNCSLEVQPREGREVRTFVPGRLVEWKKLPGETVLQEEVICILENLDLEVELVKAQSEERLSAKRLEQLKIVANNDPTYAVQVAEEEKVHDTSVRTVEKLEEKKKRLVVRSPIAGIVCQPPDKAENKQLKAQEQLPSWSGNPFHLINEYAVFGEGELICIVAPTQEMEGVLVVDQHDKDLITRKKSDDPSGKQLELDPEGGYFKNAQVEVMFESAKLESIYGRIKSFAQSEMKEASPALSTQAGGSLDTKVDETGKTLPMSTSYQAKVDFDKADLPLRGGYRGEANVHLAWKSLGWRFYRYLMKTFSFEF